EDGSGWWRWTDTGTAAPDYSFGMVNGGGHYDKGVVGGALIQQFTVPADGMLTIKTSGIDGGDITMGTTTTHDFSPAQYAITDKNGKIIYPTTGNLGTVINSVPVTLPADDALSFAVTAGDVYNFILLDNYGTQIPMTFKAAVSLGGTRYDSNGLLQGASFKAQGENGWRYQYATSVTLNDTAPEPPIVPTVPDRLIFEPHEMVLLDASAYHRFGDVAPDYNLSMTTGANFNKGKPGYAHIRRFVVPSDGTMLIDTAYTTGITMGNSASHDAYPIQYAITDKNGKIVFPIDGKLGEVTYSNPVTIPQDAPLSFDVKAGDEFKFITIDNTGVQIPVNFMARVLLNGVNQDSSGNLRSTAFNAQGQSGWYYEYATSVNALPYDENEIEPELEISISHNMAQWNDYEPARMMDGSESSFAWFKTQAAGQYVQFSFNKTIVLNSISVLTAASGDILGVSDFQVSMTGNENDWQTVAELASVQRQTVEFTPVKANYARIYIKQPTANAWLKLYEVVLGETTAPEGDVNFDLSADILDLVLMNHYAVTGEKPSKLSPYDLKKDGVINESDLKLLREILLG
ncbi:MAG: discoidin domain-containing protein, partial [Clostridia bacterium]|nr:discoidin domain-containing protein [Clostridia bacterium]